VSSTYWSERLATVKALIAAYDAALLALATGQQSYTIDTGQTRNTVTQYDIASLKNVRASLLNELSTLEVRSGCGGTFYGRPEC
jgi:hypothetical protein